MAPRTHGGLPRAKAAARVDPAPEAPDARIAALDYFRAAALALMSLVHMWRFLLELSPAHRLLLFVGESAPCLFFVAFGMTQRRAMARETRETLTSLMFLGLIGMCHSIFMRPIVNWEFFLFLWAASLLVFLGNKAGLSPRGFAVLAGAVVVVNFAFPLGVSRFAVWGFPRTLDLLHSMEVAERIWLLPSPNAFYPLPWAALVFFGVAVGPRGGPKTSGFTLLCAALLAAALLLGREAHLHPGWWMRDRLLLNKWAATSTYLVAGGAWALLVYSFLQWIGGLRIAKVALYPCARLLSLYLLEGVILHYLVVGSMEAAHAQFLPSWRPGNMWLVAVWSGMDIVLLIALVWVTVRCWSIAEAWLAERRMPSVRVVGLLALALLIALQVSCATNLVSPQLMSWVAYVAMVGLAFLYRDHRARSKSEANRLAPAPGANP